jgi:hypothetical protein
LRPSDSILRLEISSPQLDLMKPILYALPGVCILRVHIGKPRSDFVEFDTFEMQGFSGMTLLWFY